jgi:hypothetical protein
LSREIYSTDLHSGFCGGTKEDAEAHYRQTVSQLLDQKSSGGSQPAPEIIQQLNKSLQEKLKALPTSKPIPEDEHPSDVQSEQVPIKRDTQEPVRPVNFGLLHCCAPGHDFSSKSAAASTIYQAFIGGCREDGFCTFPEVFDRLNGKEAQFELLTSTTIQPLKLFFTQKIVKRKIGYVFGWTKNKIIWYESTIS